MLQAVASKFYFIQATESLSIVRLYRPFVQYIQYHTYMNTGCYNGFLHCISTTKYQSTGSLCIGQLSQGVSMAFYTNRPIFRYFTGCFNGLFHRISTTKINPLDHFVVNCACITQLVSIIFQIVYKVVSMGFYGNQAIISYGFYRVFQWVFMEVDQLQYFVLYRVFRLVI